MKENYSKTKQKVQISYKKSVIIDSKGNFFQRKQSHFPPAPVSQALSATSNTTWKSTGC